MKKLVLLIVLIFGLQTTYAQTREISGKVTSESDGLGIPGVSVAVKGTTIGVSTNVDGTYRLSVPANAKTLVFSFVGMDNEEVLIGNKSIINVVLESETTGLAEVVVTAMGIEKVPDAVTSSQKILKSEDLNAAGSPSAIQALTGKVSGLQINQTNTGVVESNSIVLRGSRSITGNNQALIIIDGVKSTASIFKQLPPEVIETVNVIKGAQGAALYGSDGVNGVIMVTTVGAKKYDKLQITLNTKVDFDSPAYYPERQRKYGQGWDGIKINVENGGWGPAFDDPEFAGKEVPYGVPMYDYDENGHIDVNMGDFTPTPDDPAALTSKFQPYGDNNIDDFFVQGLTTTSDLTINASGKNKYSLLSIGYSKRDFVVEDDESEKYSVLFKGGMEINKWSVDGSFNYIHRNTSTTTSNLYYHMLQSSSDIPIEKYKDYPDRAYAWNVYYKNPYWYIKHQRYDSENDYFNTIASLAYELNEHFNIKYIANFQNSSSNGLNYRDDWNATAAYNLSDAASISSYLNKYNSASNKYYGDLLLNFDYDLTSDWDFKALVGMNYQNNTYKITEAGGSNLVIPGLYTVYNVSKPTLPYNLSNGSYEKNSYAVFGNIDLAYRDYLYINATGRNEWSSVLSDDNNSYFYPSIGVSFIPTKAMESLQDSYLSYAKIAANVTMVGNASSIGWYEINDVASLGSGFPFSLDGPTRGGLSFRNNTAPTDPDIKPEFVTSKELSIELGFLENRINLKSSFFIQNTDDLITYQSTSAASGIYRNKINIGEMESSGVEIDLGFVPIRNNNLTWEANISYYTSNSEVKKVTDQTDEVLLNGGSMVGIYAKEGESFPFMKANMYKRDDQGRIIVDSNTGNPLYTSDLQPVGRTTPKHTFGFNTSLTYKGFRLGAVMDYRTGHKFYSGTVESFTFNGMLKESADFDRAEGYIVPNSVYEDPQNPGNYIENTDLTAGNNPSYQGTSTYFSSIHNRIGENFIYDASAFKIREVSLSYTFNKQQLYSYIQGLTLGVYARNPLTILSDDNKNYNDPETSYTSGNGQGIASDDQYPVLKTYGFNVKINF